MVGVLVDDGAVLQVAEVEHAHAAVRADAGEHVPAAARLAEGNVVHFLVMGDELSLDMAGYHIHPTQYLPGLQPPHGARGVDGGGAQQIGIDLR